MTADGAGPVGTGGAGTRAVITGIGVVAPTGIGCDEHWRRLLTGEHVIGPISLFDARRYPVTLAGEVPDFDPSEYLDHRVRVQTDRWTQLGFAATGMAVAEAGLAGSTLDPYRCGVTLASSSGGNLFGQRELQRLWSQPSRTVGAYQSIAWFYAASVGQLSIRHQYKGPCGVVAAEAAGGLESLAQAGRLIRRGTPLVLAGATECPLSPYALVCQLRTGLLSTGRDPRRAYQPFDVEAAGYVPAEGGAVFVVEELSHALARGAPTIYGELIGWGATHDAVHTGHGQRAAWGDHHAPAAAPGGPSAAAGGGGQYARAIRLALGRAGVGSDEVAAIFPDALGVPAADRAEVAALRAVFGSQPPPVTTQKPLTGRAYQGGSALDVATALLALRHRVLPPSAGPQRPAPGCELDFVRAATPTAGDVALVCARGFDGFNSAVVLRGVSSDRAAASSAFPDSGTSTRPGPG